MEKFFSGFLFVFLSFLAGSAGSSNTADPSQHEISIQEKQVIESVEKGSSAALPETGAGMSQAEQTDCE